MEQLLGKLFRGYWKGGASDWDLLLAQLDWIWSATADINGNVVAAWCLDVVQRGLDPVVLHGHVTSMWKSLSEEKRSTEEVVRRLEINVDRGFPTPFEQLTLPDLQRHWSDLASRVDELESLVKYNQTAEECRDEGLESVVSVSDEWDGAARHLTDFFDVVRMSDLLEYSFLERPALARFDGPQQDQFVCRFRQFDRRQLETNGCHVAFEHFGRLPKANTGIGQVGILWHEFEKKKKLKPIRRLIEDAGKAIQAVKPVFMMSPLSIANFIPPGALEFDLVIFDEASQVRPADALGAIIRGRQVVVVGDHWQLPPTSFFERTLTGETDEDEDEKATAGIESILGMFRARGAHQRMLRWHYRSRHESLIAVSNHLFYKNLVVFPSPDQERTRLGLMYHRLDNAPYDRGRTRTNPIEAKAVAEAVTDVYPSHLR